MEKISQFANYQRLSPNTKFKIILFAGIIGLSIFFKSAIFSFFLLSLLIFWDRRFIVPAVLITPIIETVLIAADGITVTKLLVVFLVLYFGLPIIAQRKITWDRSSTLILFYFVIVLIGSIKGLYSLDPFGVTGTISYSLTTALPKIVFILLLYNYLKQNGEKNFVETLFITTFTLVASLIIILAYFIFFGHAYSTWWNIATRYSFEGADPNEFAGMICAIAVYALHIVFTNKSKIVVAFGVIAIGFFTYAVTLTVSRGGILTLLFLFIAFFTSYFRHFHMKIYLIIITSIFSIGLLLYLNIIDFYSIYERFFGIHAQGITRFTSNRSELWAAAFSGFSQNPFFGYGDSLYISRYISFKYAGVFNVSHNTFIEILLRFGIFGFIIFCTIICKALKPIWLFIWSNWKINPLLILPNISLIVIIFSGMGLSWQWREILWYNIGLSLCSSHFCNKRHNRPDSFRIIV